MVYSPDVIITAPGGGADGNIGAIVTDLTLYGIYGDGKEELAAYLSLKLGTTATFFNVGVLKVLKTSEIKEGMVQESDGKRLLNLLGVENVRMCQIFNGDFGVFCFGDCFGASIIPPSALISYPSGACGLAVAFSISFNED